MKSSDSRAARRRSIAGTTGAAEAAPVLAAPPTVMPGRYTLSDDACRVLLLDIGWGILSVVEEERVGRRRSPARPFGVPVAYALDAGAIYVATGGGRKLDALEANPRLCLTVTDVQGFDKWRSVVLMGTARWLVDARERGRAIQSFAIQRRPRGYALGPDDARRFLNARILRIDIDELHGMARGEWASDPERALEAAAAAASARASDAPPPAPAPLPSADIDGDATRTMQGVRRLFRALRAAGDDAHRTGGLTPAQLFVLRQLATRPGQTVSELARRTLTTQSTVSEVVARLVARGLVSREVQPDDRRRTHLSLTPEGSALIAAAPEPIQERLVRAFRALPSDERRTLARTLELWVAQAGLAELPATMFFEPNGSQE